MFCREQVAQLRSLVPEIHARGAELVVVGNGNRHFAKGFKDEIGLTTPLYVDTARGAYRALEMKRSVWATLDPRLLGNMVRALRGGFRQGRTKGDPWQQGGVLVVRPGGKVAYRYLSAAAGDHPPTFEVMAALPPA